MRQRGGRGGVQSGAPFKVPSYLVHPLVVPSIRFRTLVSNAYHAPSLCSVANIAPRFASSLGDAPSLRSVAGGCSLTSFSRWGMLPHFVQSLGDAPSLCSVALTLLRFALSLSIQWFHQIGKCASTPILTNEAINMHS